MKAQPFSYSRPASLSAACEALAATSANALAIAGGQSLMPMMALRVAACDVLVDLSRLPDLKGACDDGDRLVLGAATTHADIEDGRAPDPANGLMARVASRIAYRAVRNHGTIGGSLALCDPAADWPACLLALDARVRIAGTAGVRVVEMDAFLKGPYSTDLKPGEVITAIEIAKRPSLRWGAAKVTRKSGAFASSMAIAVKGDGGPVRVVLGALSSRPRVLPQVSAALAAGGAAWESAVVADVRAADPGADDYAVRAHAATVRKAVREALQR